MSPELLAELRDIHLPPDPLWWPPAPGWWLAAVFAVLVLIGLGVALRRHAVRTRPRRRALELLHDIAADIATDVATDTRHDRPHPGLQRLSRLLRRVALQAFPREQVAGLSGDRWLQFLDRSGGTDQFTSGSGQPLATGPYRPVGSVDLTALVGLSDRWIRRNL